VLCTQALPASCSTCYAASPTPSPYLATVEKIEDAATHFSSHKAPRTLNGRGAIAVGDGDTCASCRMSLPDDAPIDSQGHAPQSALGRTERPPLRTKEEVHICTNQHAEFDDGDIHLHSPSPESYHSTDSESCHTHSLEYVSNSNPAESETFSSLRRATIRTLSIEQLPRGQTSGPLWFGDPVAGYTIAYVFRLADLHARGRQRYYALLALAGSDTQRAFEACTLIWGFFEQIAMNIVQTAEDVAANSFEDESPPQQGHITPVSAFLTRRSMDPDGHPRGGMANVRANGIADLVNNQDFFCELHMMFVGILQDLGKLLGGMRVKPVEADFSGGNAQEETKVTAKANGSNEREGGRGNQADLSPSVAVRAEIMSSDDVQHHLTQRLTPLCSPGLTAQRHQVAV